MKKLLLVQFLFHTIFNFCTAQSFAGFLTDNYAGVHAVISNPANIADSRLKTDINIVGFSAGAYNDIYRAKFSDFFKIKDIESSVEKKLTPKNSLASNVDVLGLAWMGKVKEGHNLAIYTRSRSMLNIANIDGNLIDAVYTSNNTVSYNVTNQNANLSTNNWLEGGASYALDLFEGGLHGEHFLKAGLTLKYLYGYGNNYVQTHNVNIKFSYLGNPDLSNYVTSGIVDMGNIGSLEQFKAVENYQYFNALKNVAKNNGQGIGGDIGLVYEYRPDIQLYTYENEKGEKVYHKDENKYKLKVGLSLTDFGTIAYKNNVKERTFDVGGTNIKRKVQSQEFGITYKILPGSEKNELKAKLPFALHFNIDWNILNRWYLNVNTDRRLLAETTQNASFIQNNITVTPRFESQRFSAYLPLSIYSLSGFQAGFGLRYGGFYFGSGSIITALIQKTQSADVYLGLKIPFYQPKIEVKPKPETKVEGTVPK
jgi:hypothetical protein